MRSLFRFFELLGAARAAAQLSRLGYYDEANRLMQELRNRP